MSSCTRASAPQVRTTKFGWNTVGQTANACVELVIWQLWGLWSIYDNSSQSQLLWHLSSTKLAL